MEDNWNYSEDYGRKSFPTLIAEAENLLKYRKRMFEIQKKVNDMIILVHNIFRNIPEDCETR